MTAPQEAAVAALAHVLPTIDLRYSDGSGFGPGLDGAMFEDHEADHWAVAILAALQAKPDAARDVVALLGGDTLDAAWREAEAALPDGWFIGLLVWAFPSAVASPEVAWTASAADYSDDDGPAASGTGPTPTAALRDLAAKLREKP